MEKKTDAEKMVEYEKKVRTVAVACKADLPGSYYRYGIANCWKCKREIIVYSKPIHTLWDKSEPKEKPIPGSFKLRYSKTVNSEYWVNVCPFCSSIQGDWFLHSEPDGTFFGVGLAKNEVDSEDRYRKDLEIIAIRYIWNKGL